MITPLRIVHADKCVVCRVRRVAELQLVRLLRLRVQLTQHLRDDRKCLFHRQIHQVVLLNVRLAALAALPDRLREMALLLTYTLQTDITLSRRRDAI